MKKTLFIAGLALAALSNAYAEDRLFPTYILPQGEIDARIDFNRQSYSTNIHSRGNSGLRSSDFAAETLQARFGLGSNWYLGLAIPYRFHSDSNTDYSNPPGSISDNVGERGQNPALFASYGIVNDKTSPFFLNANMQLTPDTTGSVKTSYKGGLTAGWQSSDTLRFYSSLSAEIYDASNVPNRYSIKAGAYKALSDTLCLVPHVAYVRFASTSTLTSVDQETIGLSANIRIARNFYIIPDMSFFRNGALEKVNGDYREEASSKGKSFSLGAYYLF